jgi:hypothetical protein
MEWFIKFQLSVIKSPVEVLNWNDNLSSFQVRSIHLNMYVSLIAGS